MRCLLSCHHPEEQLQLRHDMRPDQLHNCQFDFSYRLRGHRRFSQLRVQNLPERERLHLQLDLRRPGLWQHLLSILRSSRGIVREHRLHRQLLVGYLLGQRNNQPVQRHLRLALGYHFHQPRLSFRLPVRCVLYCHHPEEQLQLRHDVRVDQLHNCKFDFDHRLRGHRRFNQLRVQNLPERERLHLQLDLRRPGLWQRLLSFLRSSRGIVWKHRLHRQLLVEHLLG